MGLIIVTVPEIMHKIYNMYGTITPQALTAEREKLGTTTYDHSFPIANLFTTVNDYSNIDRDFGAPDTP